MSNRKKDKRKKNKANDPVPAEESKADVSKEVFPAKKKVGKFIVLVTIIVCVTAAGLLLIDFMNRAPLREARTKILEKDYTFAMTVLKDYLLDYPNDAQALSLKAQAHAGLSEFEECRQIYEQLEGASTLEDMFAFAKSLTVLEFYAEAFSNWIGVMSKINEGELDGWPPERKNRYLAEALYFMAACQTELGKLDRAFQTSNDLVGVEGQEALGRYIRGLVQIKRGNSTSAIEDWKKVTELDPNLVKITVPPMVFHYEMGVLCVEEGLSREGIQYLDKSLTLNRFQDLEMASNSMEAIGSAYEELGESDQAEFYWKKQIDFQKQFNLGPSLITREGLANIALVNKKPVVAINFLSPLRESGDLKSSTTYLMQRALTMMGKTKEAKDFQELTRELREKETKINTIREALREKSDTYWAVVIRAYDFAKGKNWRQARQLLNTVKQHLTDDFSVRLLKAVDEQSTLPPLTDIDIDIF